ncbi:hypothetical protein LA080_008631 [Diaporthe eres]|nr:hypothetical protein LA080_008631 [Diaporthe eres]
MEGGGRLFRNASCRRYARVGGGDPASPLSRGCPGLIILRHLSASRVLRRDQARLQHDVTPSPIRVLADFILTQPATPDIRTQIWAPWRTWARQTEVICNPTDTIPKYRHDRYVLSTPVSSWTWELGIWKWGHGTGAGNGAEAGTGHHYRMAPATLRSLSSRSRPLLRRALRHNIIVVIIIAMPPHCIDFGVGWDGMCYVHPKEATSHHSTNNTTKSRFIGTSGLGHPSNPQQHHSQTRDLGTSP